MCMNVGITDVRANMCPLRLFMRMPLYILEPLRCVTRDEPRTRPCQTLARRLPKWLYRHDVFNGYTVLTVLYLFNFACGTSLHSKTAFHFLFQENDHLADLTQFKSRPFVFSHQPGLRKIGILNSPSICTQRRQRNNLINSTTLLAAHHVPIRR